MEAMLIAIMFMIVMVLGGLFSIAGAVFNWNFFFEHRRARRLVKFIGRNGARIFYILLGIFVIFCGVMFVIFISHSIR